MSRPSRSSSGPPRKQIQELFSFPSLWDPKCLQVQFTQAHILYVLVTETCKHLGTHNAGKLNDSWISFLGGPEDDLIGRNMSP